MVLLGLLVAHAALACDDRVRLRLTPEVKGSTASVLVDVWFKGDASPTTDLRHPWNGREPAELGEIRAEKPAKLAFVGAKP